MRGKQLSSSIRGIAFLAFSILFTSPIFAQNYSFKDLSPQDFQVLPEDLQSLHKQNALVRNLIIRYPNGVIKKSIFIGSPNAPIINAMGGTFTNSLYMREYALRQALKIESNLNYTSQNLAMAIRKKNFAINLTEPSGFGNQLTGVIHSSESQEFGMIEMIAEHLYTVNVLSEISGYKVLNIGHSLGGFIIDFSSIGVKTDSRGRLFLDHDYGNEIAKKTKGNILLGTPFALAHHDFDASLIPLLTIIGPNIVDQSPKIQKIYTWLYENKILKPKYLHLPLSQLQKTSSTLLPGLFSNLSLIPLVDLKYLRAQDLHELARNTLSNSYPLKILKEFSLMLTDGDLRVQFENHKDMSLRALYKSGNVQAKIPSFITTNLQDPVSRPKDLLMHSTFLKALGVKSEDLLQEGGHMNSALGILIVDSVEAAAKMFQKIESSLETQESSRYCRKSAS
ncbi:MAG: hypothetical protein VX642_00420 [Bdellovibrionota bacterium]|nr:hypothetical protein [Bdellovibrionota bacterium]